MRESRRRWNEQNPGKASDAVRRWSDANRERLRAGARRRYWESRDHYLEKMRRRRDANPHAHREYSRQWRKDNPEMHCEQSRRRRALSRSARQQAIMPLAVEELRKRFALFGDRCSYCGLADRLTVDHVLALAAGGLDEGANIVPACVSCNSGKKDRQVEAWYRRQPFFTEARWRKIQRHCPGAAMGQLPLALPA
jgi:5-methylcytosine-specific restriction endonuclease McrA